MKKDFYQKTQNPISTIYNYLVLFATLMMVIGGSVGVFMSLADIIFPEPHYQTFQDYKKYKMYDIPSNVLDENIVSINTSDEELRIDYDEMLESDKNRQVIGAKNRLFKSFGWLLIPLPIFLFFQRRVFKKEEKNYDEEVE